MSLNIKKIQDIERYSAKELNTAEALELISPFVLGTYITYETSEIEEIYGYIEKFVSRADAELGANWPRRSSYANFLILLRFGLLPKLSETEVATLFEKNLLYIIKEEDDVISRIQYSVLIWGDFKGKIRKAILESIINSYEDFNGVTVHDWVIDYENNIIPEQRGAFSLENYLTRSKLVVEKKLISDDKEILRKVLKLYDWLKQGGSLPGEMVFSELRNRKTSFTRNIVSTENIMPVSETKPILKEADQIKEEVELVDKPREIITKPVVKPVASESLAPTTPALPQINSNAFIHTAPQTFKSTKPALVFDMEDEKEADKHRDKAGTQPVLEHVIRQFVDEIIKDKNLIFKDEVNQRRFVQLMVSRLKDVRGPLEIAEALRKPIEAGGLGMPEEKADQVQTIVEAAKQDFEDKRKQGELKASLPAPVYTPEPVIKVQPPKPAFDPEAARIWREQMLREIQTQNQPVNLGAGLPASQQVATQRPQLVDVKAPPKVVGPLEELRSLTLIDFRRLGATPQEALQKIKGKIDLLGETSIGRKLEAVKAWKSSVVYQQYLRLGRESIEQGKHISAMVGSHQALGEPVLTENEFTAIADFNARLRF